MKNTGLTVVVLLLVAGAAVGVLGTRYFLNSATAPGLSSTVPPAPVLPPDMPPLEGSDAYVRAAAEGLSPDPAFREWLKLDSLVSRLSAAMNMIAHGKFPREILVAFAPRGKYLTAKRDGRVFVDPAGYARYDAVGALARGLDAAAAAKVFTALLPLFDAAQRALGEPNASGREALLSAARELLSAPLIDGDVALKEGKRGLGWAYADERLENLSPARKQMLRLGPRNEAEVQAKIRAIALALGANDLPRP